MYRYLLLLLFCMTFQVVFSQEQLQFRIVDSNKNPIENASIVLKNDKDENIIDYTFSDDKGYFQFQNLQSKKYVVEVSAMSFEKQILTSQSSKKTNSEIIEIVLQEATLELDEVFIQSQRPITIKKDTIIFDIKSFARGNEQVVEDLLKNLPGFNVDDNGTIKIGNKEIEKVMVEGDDFFEKGYTLLTKNMPANPVEKVELYQHYSNNKHLKGVENSDKVAINLTLKEDFKRQWFGNFSGGYGLASENRYELKSNLMNFGKKNKYYFLSNFNNIGLDAVGDINHLIRPFRLGEPGSIGDNQTSNEMIALGAYNPNLKQKRVNFNNAEMVSLNSIFTLSPKVKMKILGFFNADENNFYRNSFQSFFIQDAKFENTEDFKLKKNMKNGFGKIDITYDISKTKTLEYTGKFSNLNTDTNSNLIFNSVPTNENLNGENQFLDQKLFFTTKLKENKVVLLTVRYIQEKTPQSYKINRFFYEDLFPSLNVNNVTQTSENEMQFAGFEVHVMDKRENDDLLEIKLGNEFRSDNLNSIFELKQANNSVLMPQGFQNDLDYSSNNAYILTKYSLKLKKIRLTGEFDFHTLYNKLESDKIQRENTFYVNPRLGVEWEINSKHRISSSFSSNLTNAGIIDVYDGFILANYRSFEKGLGSFNQTDSKTASLVYTLGNWSDKFFANFNIIYNENNDFYSTNSRIFQNYSQSQKIIIHDREFLSMNSNTDYFFRTISSNLKLNLGISKANFKNIVNDSDLREIKNLNVNYGVELRSGFKGFFNYHFGTKWNYSKVETSISNSFTNNTSFLDLSFMIDEKFNFEIESERYYFGNLDKKNSDYYFLDLEARFIAKKNKLNFYLSGNNLLNTKTFQNYSISDISISQTEYRLLPRYVLLKMEYRF